MPKSRMKRYLPTPAQLRESKALRPIAHLLHKEDIWHMNRRSVSGAFFVGLFSAFLPLPSQMVIAAFLAIAARVNLPISVALVWITNPITIGPMFYFAYRLGAWLLDMQMETASVDLSLGWLWDNFGTIGWPLLFGSVVCGWVAGISGFVLTRLIWRFAVIRRWRERRRLKRAQRKSDAIEAPQSANGGR